MDKKSLFMEIEQCREEMLTLSEKHGLDSEPVLSTSEKLDALIFAYLKKSS
ncbi:aspartyl-phosphate phosphatase Spo0E family protein [Oceanobacillus sp. FSL W7-1293]|uniref:aspartyl-phosphate phosphatase Spo0E family protein n=1 Tax=Oceanobacillus TaxID=182709 RepID=UPI0030CB8C70